MHRTIRAFLPGMLEKGGGSIVNIASGASSVRGIPNRYVYGASKAAVIGLYQVGRVQLHPQGRALQRHLPRHDREPVARRPDRHQLSKSSGQSLDAVHQAFIDRQPMGRLGKLWEIAAITASISPPTRAPSPPARPSSSMVDLHCRGCIRAANKSESKRQ